MKEMGFIEHLEELRWHIIRSIIAICIFSIVAFIAKDFVFEQVIFAPSRPDFITFKFLCRLSNMTGSSFFCIEELPFVLQSRRLTGQFTMHVLASLIVGFVTAFPYIFWEIWRFISPALASQEQKKATGMVFWVSVLFFTGVAFGYFVVSPLSINFLAHYQISSQVQNIFDISSYVTTVTMIVSACGLMFQLPLAVYFLASMGLVTPKSMRHYRRHAIIIILLISAIITPPDIVSQILIALPLTVLYQIGIFIAWRVHKKLEKNETT